MIRNYIIIAFRNMQRSKAFSIINVVGLALGMASSFIIMLWVYSEISVDRFHKHDAHLYSVFERMYFDGTMEAGYVSPGPLAEELKVKFPEVKYASGFAENEILSFEAEGKILKKEGNFAGADFFKMFSYPLLAGSVDHALNTPVSIAISKRMAEDLFGSVENAMNKSIRCKDEIDFTVTAVFDDLPDNSAIQFDFLLPWEFFLNTYPWLKDWSNNGPFTFLVLHESADVTLFRSKIKDFAERYSEDNFRVELDIQKYSNAYLYSKFENGVPASGRIQYVILFAAVAVFILLIACINFINLSTARAVKRLKEISIRKIVGAARGTLIRQFFGEALVVVLISSIIAVVAVWVSLPFFDGLVQRQLMIPFNHPYFWLAIALLIFITGLVAGSFPAMYLSSLKPVGMLKGATTLNSSGLSFRKVLVTFQFSLSLILLIGTMVVSQQMNYMQSYQLGYDREHLMYIPLEGELPAKYSVFKNQLVSSQSISSVTKSTYPPNAMQAATVGVNWEGKKPDANISFSFSAVGHDFVKTLNLPIVRGREFSEDYLSDSSAYIINESAMKVMGYEDPIGKPLTFWQTSGTIIGVVKDAHFNSLHYAVPPMIFRLDRGEERGYALVKTEAGNTAEALQLLEKVCKELNPKSPFTYQFADLEYAKMYASKTVVSKLSNTFASLAIFISSLGLLGLMIFTTAQRTKEIGIRKVLGASISLLFALLLKEIFLLVVIALCIASPLAWLAMKNWLSNYAYHIEYSWLTGLVAAAFLILIALVTISYQTARALLENPVNSLRTE